MTTADLAAQIEAMRRRLVAAGGAQEEALRDLSLARAALAHALEIERAAVTA